MLSVSLGSVKNFFFFLVCRCSTVSWCWGSIGKSMEYHRSCCFNWLCFEHASWWKRKAAPPQLHACDYSHISRMGCNLCKVLFTLFSLIFFIWWVWGSVKAYIFVLWRSISRICGNMSYFFLVLIVVHPAKHTNLPFIHIFEKIWIFLFLKDRLSSHYELLPNNQPL